MSHNPAYTESMNRLTERFATLPGIGRRTAERLAFHVLKSSPDEALALAKAIEDVKTNVRHCSICFNLTEDDPCNICTAAEQGRRDPRHILVVEQPKDLITLEDTGVYQGVYHVLLGHLSPLEGVGPDALTIGPLIDRVRQLNPTPDQPVEVVLGTNPNLEGDGTALHVGEQIAKLPHVNLTRLARGLPTGSQLEYANKSVLADAITSRRPMQ